MMALFRRLGVLLALWHVQGPASAARTWYIIDSAYVATGFDRHRWQSAQGDTSVRDVLRHLGDRQVSVVRPARQSWLFAEVTGQPHVGVGLAALLSLDISEHDGQLVVVTLTPGTPLAPLDSTASLLLTVGRIETLRGQPILAVGLRPDVMANDASARSVALRLLSTRRD